MVRYPTVPLPMPSRLYYGWVIVAAALLINLASTPMNPVVFSFFLGPMMQDLGWSRATLSWALTFRTLAGACTSPLIGAAIDRFGSRWLGVLAAAVAGGSVAALALTHQPWQVYALFALSGTVGMGAGGNMLTMVPVAKWFVARRGRAMSVLVVGFAGGTFLAIPVAQALIESAGWRQAWATFGVTMAVIIAPLSVLFMRRSPEDLGLQPDGLAAPVRAANSSPTQQTHDWTVREALRTPVLYVLLLALSLAGIALGGTLVHRVAYWREAGLSPTLVAAGTAADPFTVIFSALAFGFLAERLRVRALGLIGGSGLALSMLPMVLPPHGAVSIFAHNILWGLAAGSWITVNNVVWATFFGRRSLGSIQGVALPVTIAANAFSAPLYGFLLDRVLAPAQVWTLSAVLFLAAGLLLFAARAPVRKTAEAVA
jgi:MFS family permease